MNSLCRHKAYTSRVGQLSESLNNPSYLQLKDLTFLKGQHSFFVAGDGVLFLCREVLLPAETQNIMFSMIMCDYQPTLALIKHCVCGMQMFVTTGFLNERALGQTRRNA